ncbi:unnamed protein product, partial [Vitis vinifera]
MSMILRLQREKAEIQMEARQFKRFVEEKMAHDQQELLALEDLLYKREQSIQALTCEVQAYKHRMMSFGLTEAEAEGQRTILSRSPSMIESMDAQVEFPTYDYPPLKCNLNEIYQMERSPSSNHLDGEFLGSKNTLERVIVGQPPSSSFKKTEYTSYAENFSNLRKTDASDIGDDMTDRVYTIDSIHKGTPYSSVTESKPAFGICDDYVTTPRESLNQADVGDPEFKKLYTRLQALEADRESMRQAIISMRTDKAQMFLLREIAQHLCKEMTPERQMPIKKASVVGSFSFMSIFKWIVSFNFWKKKARQSKYMFGLTANNVGLLMLLDKGPHMRQWNYISSTQVGKQF